MATVDLLATDAVTGPCPYDDCRSISISLAESLASSTILRQTATRRSLMRSAVRLTSSAIGGDRSEIDDDSMAETKLKVILTDGADSRELLWMTHRGDEVHGGVAGSRQHTSYHRSGRRHVTPEVQGAAPYTREWKAKLHALEGVEQLQMLCFRPEPCWHGADSAFRAYHGAKYDTGLKLVATEMSRDTAYAIRVGVIGTRGLEALQEHEAVLSTGGVWTVERRCVYEGVTPWIYALLLRSSGAQHRPDAPPPHIAVGFVPEPGFALSGDFRDTGVSVVQ
jgi:hypothetical protein